MCCNAQSYTPAPPLYKPGGKTVLYEGYIINRNGAKAYNLQHKYSGLYLRFRASFYVVAEKDSLVTVSVRKNNTDNFFYVNKKDIGKETDLPITNSDLNEKYVDNTHNLNESFYYVEKEEGEQENSYEEYFNPEDYPDVMVTLITKKEFMKMAPKTLNNIIENKAVVKKNGTITIGKQKFTDEPDDGDQPNIYSYIGEYKSLNAYLVRLMCSACEEYTYNLHDKVNGTLMGSFTNIPSFSKDLQTVMDLGQLFSDSPTILSSSKWRRKDRRETYKEFANWSPVGNGYWGEDNCYYTAVIPSVTAEIHNSDAFKRNESNYNYRYIKITIKAPSSPRE